MNAEMNNEPVAGDLWAEGFAVVRGLLAEASVRKLHDYTLRAAKAGLAADTQVPGTPAQYGDPVMDKLLEALVPNMESVAHRALYPTYSYFRVYKRGDILERHTDRSPCEISLSLSLGFEASRPWPLWVQGLQRTVPVELWAGDALVYLGIRCPHWREAFEGERSVQVFLHYVDQAGRFRDWKFDKRPSLAHHSTAAGVPAVSG